MAFYERGPAAEGWKWLVLLAFGFNSLGNSFMFMDFATVADVSTATFGWVDASGVPRTDSSTYGKLNWLYSASLVAVLLPAFPMMRALNTHNFATMMFMAACNCAAAWLRYASVRRRSYSVGIASSVLVGFGCAVIVSACAHTPARWFPKRQQAFATSAAVMANYAGCALGVLLIPGVVRNTSPDYQEDDDDIGAPDDAVTPGDASGGEWDLERMMLVQALVMSACPAVTAVFHREHPARSPDAAAAPGGAAQAGDCGATAGDGAALPRQGPVSTGAFLAPPSPPTPPSTPTASSPPPSPERLSALCSPVHWPPRVPAPYVIQGFAHALLCAISFTIEAVQTAVFNDLGYSDTDSAYTNFSFVITGIATGLLAGQISSTFPAKQESVMTSLYLVASLSFTVVTVVAYNQDLVGRGRAYTIYIIGMATAGAGSLGFIGVALTHACRHLPGVSHSYSAGAIEWFVYVLSAVLAQICTTGKESFIYLAAAMWFATSVAVTSLWCHKGSLEELEAAAEKQPLLAQGSD